MSQQPEQEMSFLDHLEELRWHLVRSFIAIVIVAAIIFIFSETVYQDFLLAHLQPNFPTYVWLCDLGKFFSFESSFCSINFTDNLQSLSPTSQLMNLIWTGLILGFIIAFPYVLYEFWKFISPGLHEKERKNSRRFLLIASLLFFIGVAFSFYIIAPLSVYFFYNFKITDLIQNNFDFTTHINLITNTLLGVALMFELPVIIFFLSKLGLVTPAFLRKSRKFAIVIVLVLSAVITPPDVASQIIVSIPILFLYEIGIWISAYVERQQKKALKKI